MLKKKNPQDATLRNVRAASKKIEALQDATLRNVRAASKKIEALHHHLQLVQKIVMEHDARLTRVERTLSTEGGR